MRRHLFVKLLTNEELEYLISLHCRVNVSKPVGIQNLSYEVGVGNGRFYVGGVIVEWKNSVDFAVLEGFKGLINLRILLVVVQNQMKVVFIKEDNVRIPLKKLFLVDEESSTNVSLAGNVFCLTAMKGGKSH